MNVTLATSILAADRMTRTLVGLLVGVAVARHLGPYGYGILAWCLSLIALVTPLAAMGLDAIVTRHCVQQPDAALSSVSRAMGIRLLGALVGMAVVAAIAWMGAERNTESLLCLLLIALSLPLSTSELVDAALQARLQMARPIGLRLLAFAVSSCVRVGLVLSDAGVAWFAALLLAESATGALLVCWWCRPLLATGGDWGSAPPTSVLLRQSAPLLGADIIIALYMRIDQILLECWAGPAALGIYAVALRLSDAWVFLPSSYATARFPGLVATQGDPAGIRSDPVMGFLRRMAWISLACASIISASAWMLIPLLFGADYHSAVFPASILPWASFFACLGIARGRWLVAAGLQRYSFGFIAIGGATGTAMTLLLIPRYGIDGAAVAAVATQAVIALGAPLIFAKTRITVTALLLALAHPPPLRILRGRI